MERRKKWPNKKLSINGVLLLNLECFSEIRIPADKSLFLREKSACYWLQRESIHSPHRWSALKQLSWCIDVRNSSRPIYYRHICRNIHVVIPLHADARGGKYLLWTFVWRPLTFTLYTFTQIFVLSTPYIFKKCVTFVVVLEMSLKSRSFHFNQNTFQDLSIIIFACIVCWISTSAFTRFILELSTWVRHLNASATSDWCRSWKGKRLHFSFFFLF